MARQTTQAPVVDIHGRPGRRPLPGSSCTRAPDGPWARTWLLGLALTVCLLGGMELFWRGQGHQPSIVDDPQWWAFHRSKTTKNGSSTVALLGASRIQLDFSTETFRKLYPDYDVVQLAIDGRHPIAGLRDLAEDEAFGGIVICAITAAGFELAAHDDQQEYVDYYHNRETLNSRLNRLIGCALQDRLVVVNPQVNLKKTLTSAAVSGRLPKPLYLTTHYDRSRSADYSLIDIEKHRNFRVERHRRYYISHESPDPEVWLAQAAEVEPLVKKIQNRGGKVVFARLPTSGEYYELDQLQYPRDQYWDRFAKRTSAATLHFMDIPELRGFDCPDGSHLDGCDKQRFTGAFANELKRLGLFSTEAMSPSLVRQGDSTQTRTDSGK